MFRAWFDIRLITAAIAKKWSFPGALQKSEKGRKIIELSGSVGDITARQELLSIVATAHLSRALTCMENYDNSSHAWSVQSQKVQSIIHLLMECYRNWGENSETAWDVRKWVKQTMKIGGTNSKGNYLEMIVVVYLCAPPLPAWRSYGSHLKLHDCTSHARRIQ